MAESEDAPPTFEEALGALEARVTQLESGEVPLDRALALFEEGMALAEDCHARLEAAEQRVAKLVRVRGGVDEEPLPEPEGEDGLF